MTSEAPRPMGLLELRFLGTKSAVSLSRRAVSLSKLRSRAIGLCTGVPGLKPTAPERPAVPEPRPTGGPRPFGLRPTFPGLCERPVVPEPRPTGGLEPEPRPTGGPRPFLARLGSRAAGLFGGRPEGLLANGLAGRLGAGLSPSRDPSPSTTLPRGPSLSGRRGSGLDPPPLRCDVSSATHFV